MDALNTILDEAFEEAAVDFIIIDTQGGGGVWADTIAAQVQIIVVRHRPLGPCVDHASDGLYTALDQTDQLAIP